MAFDWNEAAVAELRRLWCDQGVAAADIARLLSKQFGQETTRNAVLGRAHRMRLEKGTGTVQAPEADAAQPATRAGVEACPGATLMQLASWHCRYILPEAGQGTRYCGQLTDGPKSSWCACHSKVVWERRPAVTAEKYRDHLIRQLADKRAASRSPAFADEQA